MICCTVIGTRNKPAGFECVGHAGHGESGYDIVCAGVSALTITCANGLEKIAKCPVTIKEEEGYLKVEVVLPLSEKQQERGALLLQTMFLGIEEIARAYPDHVCFKG